MVESNKKTPVVAYIVRSAHTHAHTLYDELAGQTRTVPRRRPRRRRRRGLDATDSTVTLGRVAERVFKDFLSAICYAAATAAAAAVSIVLGRFSSRVVYAAVFKPVRRDRIFRENAFVLIRRRPGDGETTAKPYPTRPRCRRIPRLLNVTRGFGERKTRPR